MTKSTYNEKSIKQLSGFEHIRHRPSAYLVDSHKGLDYATIYD